MKNSVVQITAIVFGAVVMTAAQDMSPALAGVKPPFVPAAMLFVAFLAPLTMSLVTATAIGLFMDALAGVPALCATSLLPLLALGAHFLRGYLRDTSAPVVGACATTIASVLGETWLSICGFSPADTELLVRICAAAILAAPVGAALFALLPWIGRHMGLEDGQ